MYNFIKIFINVIDKLRMSSKFNGYGTRYVKSKHKETFYIRLDNT